MKIHDPFQAGRLLQRLWLCRLRLGGCTVLAAASLLLIGPQITAQAQSDNFDSYSSAADFAAAGWILSSLNPALVSTTFPTVGAGKGLRIQANPVPSTAPAVGMWYRTNDYTDFYVSVDIASWPGTDKNQAAVMFARMTDAAAGTVVPDQNPASAQGIICNYDTSQYGENPGDRRQGQFQINIVGAGFATLTLAAADMTFEPGRAYRLIFKGTAWHYTAQAYDWNDLTTPLVTIEADDTMQVNPHGACGLLAFSRQGNTGTADLTLDNYVASTTDPNTGVAPALPHPVPGTPVVNTRVPSKRWSNFLNPATPISFTATTYGTNLINASATRLLLNGVDVSASLTLSANATNITGSLAASALTSNKLYRAEIVITDLDGVKTSTNSFWFDTFAEPFLRSSSVKTIEAEEYNHDGGMFELDPIPVSGIDTNGNQVNGGNIGYLGLVGLAGIDFSNHNATPDANFAAFRAGDAVRTLNGGLIGIQDANHPTEFDPGTDTIRYQHGISNLLEYVVCRTEPGEWLNFTRAFASAFYTAYLRYSSFGATTNELYLVTSDATQPDQTAVKLGTFTLLNNIRQLNYLYAPLLDDKGAPALMSLSGTNTLRIQMAGVTGQDNRKTMLNYLMMVQAPISVVSCATVNGTYTPELGANVNAAARTITLPASGATRFYRVSSSAALSIKGISVAGGIVTLSL